MEKINRREFIRKSAVAGAASIFGGSILSSHGLLHAAGQIDLSVVKGQNYFKNTVKAVEQLGGMRKFVSKGAKVGILANTPFTNPGTHTNPDIVLALVKMCFDAEAEEVCWLKNPPDEYCEKSSVASELGEEIKKLKLSSENYAIHKIQKGIALKKAEIVNELFECDVFINIPVSKHHEGTNFSCCLKNMMGLAPHSTNRFFHSGSGTPGWYGNIDHTNQCIADINLIRNPTLCVVDATEFISTNGPFGPGKIVRPQKVVAGTDPVLADAYCSTLMGLDPGTVGMIGKAVKHGLGKADLGKANILETEV